MPNHITIDDRVVLLDIVKVLDTYSIPPEFRAIVLSRALTELIREPYKYDPKVK